MENEENEDDEESFIIAFVNLLKQKVINFKVSPPIFKVYIYPKFIFTLLMSWIYQYKTNNIIQVGFIPPLRGVC